MDKITVYKTLHGWRWSRRASNGEIIAASSEEYIRQDDCRTNITRTQGGKWELVVNGDAPPAVAEEVDQKPSKGKGRGKGPRK